MNRAIKTEESEDSALAIDYERERRLSKKKGQREDESGKKQRNLGESEGGLDLLASGGLD